MGKFRFLLRTNYMSKAGNFAVIAKYTSNNKVFQANTGVETFPQAWNNKKQIILPTDADHYNKNLLLKNLKIKADKIILENEVAGKYLDTESFKKSFVNKPDFQNNDFYEYLENEILLKKKILKNNTIRQYKATLSKLKQFQTRLSFNELNSCSFFQKFESHMTIKLANKQNTICKNLKILKTIINEAVRKNIITKNNVNEYKVKYKNPERNFLTIDEIHKIEEILPDLPERLKNTARCFLFCCYTGLRYGDIKNLKFKNICHKHIEIIQEKTSEPIKIPLHKKALALINQDKSKPSDMVFNVYSNQKINDYLKPLLYQAGIYKNITFHCSRHTFATISLNINIPLNVVSKFLGHCDMKTTLIYAKLLEDTKANEMNKWDDI